MSVERYEHGQAVVHHWVRVDEAGWDESQQPYSRKPLCVPVLPDRPCLHHLASGWRRRKRMCELNEVMTTSIYLLEVIRSEVIAGYQIMQINI